MKTRMSKREAVMEFEECILSQLDVAGLRDVHRVNEAWDTYTDSLCKDGSITQYQYDTWTRPVFRTRPSYVIRN